MAADRSAPSSSALRTPAIAATGSMGMSARPINQPVAWLFARTPQERLEPMPCSESWQTSQRKAGALLRPSAVAIAWQNAAEPGRTTTVVRAKASSQGSRLCAASGRVTPCSVSGCSSLSAPNRCELPAASTMAAMSAGSDKIFLVERHAAQALAGEGEHGVGHRRRNRRRAGLADTGGVLVAFHDMHLDLRHLGKAQRRVVVEVRLHHPAVLQRNRPVQRGRQAVDDAALDLLPNPIRI